MFRTLRWHRRTLAAGAAFLAVLIGLGTLQPPHVPVVPVVAVARDLPGGSVLGSGDLLVLDLPTEVAPVGAAADKSVFVGQTINAPLSARSVLTRASVSGGQALAAPGLVVVSVSLANPVLAAALTPGSRIDLIASGSVGVVARNARVVALPEASTGGFAASSQRFLLVEVTPDAASRIAGANAGAGLTVAVH